MGTLRPFMAMTGTQGYNFGTQGQAQTKMRLGNIVSICNHSPSQALSLRVTVAYP